MRISTPLVLLLVACRPHAPAPAPVDAGPAARSSASEAGADASAATSWTTSTVDGCEVRLADDPARAPVGLVWGACTGATQPAGDCRELLSPVPDTNLFVVGARAAGGTMLMVRAVTLSGSGERYVLGPPDGPPRVVITLKCARPAQPGAIVVGAEGAAIELQLPRRRAFLAGPLSAAAAWGQPAAGLSEAKLGETILDEPFAVAGRSIRAVDARRRVLRSAPATGEFTTWPVGAAFRSTLGRVRAAGDATLFMTDSIPEAIGLQLGSAPPVVWFQPPAGGGVSAPALDGATLYFLQGRGRDSNNGYAGIDVYSAPTPTSAAPPAARRVGGTSAGGMRWMQDPVAGAGHVAWRVWQDREHAAVDVLDVATGRRVRFTPPQDRRVGRLVFVDDRELGVEVVDAAANHSMTASSWTWRVRLASLPAAP